MKKSIFHHQLKVTFNWFRELTLKKWKKCEPHYCCVDKHGSYRFLYPKFKTFSRLFSLFHNQGYQIGDQQRSWKTHELCFSYEALQTCINHSARRLNKVWLRVKKTSFTNQKIQPLYHFSRIFLYFPDYFQIWKIALQISRVFKNSRLCKNQVKYDFKHLTNKTYITNLHSIQPHLRSQHCACAVRYSVSSFLSSEVPKQTNKLLF